VKHQVQWWNLQASVQDSDYLDHIQALRYWHIWAPPNLCTKKLQLSCPDNAKQTRYD